MHKNIRFCNLCSRYTEGDYHHLKKSKIDRSSAVTELAKAHSMGASTDSDIIPENLRLYIPKPSMPASTPPPNQGSPVPLTPSPKPIRPLLREHPRSASSHSMHVYREQHLTPPPHFSSLQKIERAYSDDRSFEDPHLHSQLRSSRTMEETMRRSTEDSPLYRSMEDSHYHRRSVDESHSYRFKEDSPRRSSRQEERIKLYTQERARSCVAPDVRSKGPLESRSHTSLQIPGSSDERDSEQQPRSRLRRPSIGEIKVISPTLTRRINERVPYIKKQRSMSEDLPMSPLVHTQKKYSSRESLPIYSQQHQVSVEVHHEPPPCRFFPTSPSRLAVKTRDPHQSRSFEVQSVTSKDMYVQRRVKSYEMSEREHVENHDRLEITQFMRSTISNSHFDVMQEGVGGELKSKVRYNDTGSLEDLNDSVPIDEIVTETLTVDDSETETCSTINGQNPKYKDLWNLRATLEEEEDLSDTIRMEDMVTSPDDQSPEEKDPGTSYTTSFESNTEPVIDPENLPAELVSEDSEYPIASSNLLKPQQNRRQTYRTLLNRHVKQTQSGQTSLDSMETDGEVSDTSRHEVTTTSFESTTGTDNTDSTGDGSNASKLQQMRGDSGYKSLETQQSQGQNDQLAKPPKRQIQFIIEKEGPAAGIVVDTEYTEKSKSAKKLSPQSASAPIASTSGTSSHHKSSKHSTFDRRNGKTASKKRRDFHSERKSAAVKVHESIPEPESDSHSDKPSGDSFETDNPSQQRKPSLFSRFIKQKPSKKPSLTRDYSIDSKTNALFHEFLRHDPVLDNKGLHPPRLSDNTSSSVPASFDMTGGGRRDRLSPEIRSASLGSNDKHSPSAASKQLLSVSPQASIEEEDEDAEEDERKRYRRRLSASRRRSMSESAATALAQLHVNIPVIKLPTEDEEP